MQVNEINDKTDGVEDWLLPNTQLKYAYRDSKRDDSAAFFGALALTQDVFGGDGVSAIVGAASSGPSASAAIVTARSLTPQISYSSSSPLLSDGRAYSYFLRTVPSDAFQSDAIVDVLQNLFEYTSVSTIASTDSYGSAGISAFLSAAANANPPLAVLTSQNFARDTTDFSEQLRGLRNVSPGARDLKSRARRAAPVQLPGCCVWCAVHGGLGYCAWRAVSGGASSRAAAGSPDHGTHALIAGRLQDHRALLPNERRGAAAERRVRRRPRGGRLPLVWQRCRDH